MLFTIKENLDSIIRKIKGLMALAEDNANEEEAQSAFVMAQKMMMKYNIEQSEIEGVDEKPNITEGQASAFKTLYWYEKSLALIIADNFRVEIFLRTSRKIGSKRSRLAVAFYGLEQDVKIAKEMYILANEALIFYTNRYVETYYATYDYVRERSFTTSLKNSYMQGFISGLKEKMDSQRFALQEEFGLALLTPKVVVDSYKDFTKDMGKGSSWTSPNVDEQDAYQQGYNDGEAIDYTKSTVDDETI